MNIDQRIEILSRFLGLVEQTAERFRQSELSNNELEQVVSKLCNQVQASFEVEDIKKHTTEIVAPKPKVARIQVSSQRSNLSNTTNGQSLNPNPDVPGEELEFHPLMEDPSLADAVSNAQAELARI